MKALGYFNAHPLDAFAIKEITLPEPQLRSGDVLVRIKAIAANPVDYKIRSSRSAEGDRPVILGWDAAGVIEKIGSNVQDFAVGDAVYYAGDLTRDGSYAELQAVDHRLIAHKPTTIDFAAAASLPLTTLTAWEALLEKGISYTPQSHLLIIGAGGGVGSIAVQIAKAKTPACVIGTASRADTAQWIKNLGADHVIDHSKPLAEQLAALGIAQLDVIFGTNRTESYLEVIPQLLRPFGHLCLIDDPASLDIVSFKRKALSVHWEFMFAKSMHGYAEASQGKILSEMAALVDSGRVKPTVISPLSGITVENIKHAHMQLEKGSAIGKIVLKA